jgi:predicted transglutaminase-like cysteine proteinase
LVIRLRPITFLVIFLFTLRLIQPIKVFSEEIDGFGSSISLNGVPEKVNDPLSLAAWLANEFRYEMEFPNRWQAPSDTIKKKKGDCEDFAALASSCLNRLGIENKIALLKFDGLNLSHAICIWKDSGGNYSFISNRKLKHTGETDINRAVKKYYPDCVKITFLK